MEVRSSRRMRTLVTQWSNRGLSGNENARALISMMARSKCSNQRPDTLMRDRSPPARRNHLQRAAGPYIGSKTVLTAPKRYFQSTPNNGHHQTDPLGPGRATNGLVHRNNKRTRLFVRKTVALGTPRPLLPDPNALLNIGRRSPRADVASA